MPRQLRRAASACFVSAAVLATPSRASDEDLDVHVFAFERERPASPAAVEATRADYARRFGSLGPAVVAALRPASEVLPMIVAAVHPFKPLPTVPDWRRRQRLGTSLAVYADIAGGDRERFETFVAAARRIVADGSTALRSPEATSRWFDATADVMLANVRAVEAAAGNPRAPALDALLTDVEVLAHLARFHAHRILGAVHYNLFTRSLKLGELYAATLEERQAVAAWRQLVSAVGERHVAGLGARRFGLAGSWRDELTLLETGLKDLEAQCCPPDDATLKQSIWSPLPR